MFKSVSVFLLLLLSPSFLVAQPSYDDLIKVLKDHDQVKGAVCIRKGDSILYQNYFDTKSSNQVYRYRIGSISKTFTSTLVFMAVEEGKLSLDDSLNQWYPFSSFKGIQIKHLLEHRSGLHNFTNDPNYSQIMEKAQTEADMLKRFAQMERDFKADEKQEYSNTNFVLLSYILEKVYQQAYSQILATKIVGPLKLENTYYPEENPRDSLELSSFTYLGSWTKASNTHPSIPLGAGGIVSNPADLCIFFQALLEGKLVSKASLKEMKVESGLGKGLMTFPFYEKRAYGHNGGIDGFMAHASYFPAEKMSISVCLNGSQYPLNDLLIDLLSISFDKEGYQLPEFKSIQLGEAELNQYVGNYKSANFPLDIKVFVEGEQLKAQATNQAAFPLNAVGKHQFEFKAAGIKMTFDPEANTMAFEQYNLKVPFKR